MSVWPAHQNRETVRLSIPVDHVVLRSFHFKHRFFQGHWFASIAMVHAKNLLAFAGVADRTRPGGAFSALAASNWRGRRFTCLPYGLLILMALSIAPFVPNLQELFLELIQCIVGRLYQIAV